MKKYLASGASALLALGLAAQANQISRPSDDDNSNAAPVAIAAADDASKDEESPDTAEDLREIYFRLKSLRAERLDERPRVLADRAAKIYRDGVAAYAVDDAVKARSYSEAARALTQAIELSRRAVKVEQDDPELPPPPVPKRRVSVRVSPQTKAEVKVNVLPPALPADDSKSSEHQYKIEKRVAEKIVKDVQTKVVRVPKGAVVVGDGGESKRDGERKVILRTSPGAGDDVKLEAKVIGVPKGAAVSGDVRVFTVPREGHAFALDALRNQTGEFRVHLPQGEQRYVYRTVRSADAESRARADLQSAYDKVRAARAKNSGADAKVYLDAARDLYNAARADVEGGRYERASELSKAAEALTLVPKHLGSIGEKSKSGETKGSIQLKKSDVTKGKAHIRVYTTPKGEKKSDGDKDKGESTEKNKDSKSDERTKFEYRIRVPGGLMAEENQEDDKKSTTHAAKPLVGVGLALNVEDGKIIVKDLVKKGPADKNGKIKPGDEIVGVKGDDGEEVLFAGKELSEAVKSIAGGKAGSQIHLIIKSPDAEDRKIIVLRREKLDLSQADSNGPNANIQKLTDLNVESLKDLEGLIGDQVNVRVLGDVEALKDLEGLKNVEGLKAIEGLKTLKKLEGRKGFEVLKELKDLKDSNLKIEVVPGAPGGDGKKDEKSEKKEDKAISPEKKAVLPPPL
jgi:PDZ domain